MGLASDAAHPPEPDTDPGGCSEEDAATPELLRAAASGDAGAWETLVRLYGRRVFALARSRCGSAELAEEVTQSVMVTVATTLARGGYDERGRFESWLFRVAMNRVRDWARRSARRAAPMDPEAMAHVADPARAGEPDADAELGRLRGAMARLSDADREIVELRHHAGMSFKEIADVLDEPMGTLLARHHRALRKLREMIEPDAADADTPGDKP